MEPASGEVDELIEFWTLIDEDRELLVGKRGTTALGFALLLKQLGSPPIERAPSAEWMDASHDVEPIEEVRHRPDLTDAVMQRGLIVTGKEVTSRDRSTTTASAGGGVDVIIEVRHGVPHSPDRRILVHVLVVDRVTRLEDLAMDDASTTTPDWLDSFDPHRLSDDALERDNHELLLGGPSA